MSVTTTGLGPAANARRAARSCTTPRYRCDKTGEFMTQEPFVVPSGCPGFEPRYPVVDAGSAEASPP